MSAEKKPAKRVAVKVPKDLDEANGFIQSIGEEKRELESIKAKLNDEVAKLQAKAVEAASTHEEAIEELMDGLYVFAESHRDDLTDKGEKRSASFPTGKIGWRTTPPKVNIRNVASVIAQLKQLGLERFIRTIEEPDKEAMLKEPELAKSAKGISITQIEEFFVKPNVLDVEVSRGKKIKK